MLRKNLQKLFTDCLMIPSSRSRGERYRSLLKSVGHKRGVVKEVWRRWKSQRPPTLIKTRKRSKEAMYVFFEMAIYLLAIFHETRVRFGYSVLSETYRGDGAEVWSAALKSCITVTIGEIYHCSFISAAMCYAYVRLIFGIWPHAISSFPSK